jgi:hypothetical protein
MMVSGAGAGRGRGFARVDIHNRGRFFSAGAFHGVVSASSALISRVFSSNSSVKAATSRGFGTRRARSALYQTVAMMGFSLAIAVL